MPFAFLHRPPRKKEQRSWYENALLLAVAGSFIALFGQLADTVVPIAFGPEDISDFSIDIEGDIYQFIDSDAITGKNDSIDVGITVNDLHQLLRPYEFKIYFKAVGPMDNTTALFDPPEIRLQRRFAFLEFIFPLHSVKSKHDHFVPENDKFETKELKPYESILTLTIKNSTAGNYPITIYGIGNNGKTHNTTLYLRILNHSDYLQYKDRNFEILGNEINI